MAHHKNYPVRTRKGYCKNCKKKIQIAIFRGGDWCSDDCRKMLNGESVGWANLEVQTAEED